MTVNLFHETLEMILLQPIVSLNILSYENTFNFYGCVKFVEDILMIN